MKDYLTKINSLFPIRKSKEQKQKFINFVCSEFGDSAKVDEINKNKNIVIGNVKDAEVVLTAHYDTPASSIFPNLMMPRNKVLAMCYSMGYFLILALLSLFVAKGITMLFELKDVYFALIYLVLYFATVYFAVLCFPNKHNANDNTSGVATILEIAKMNKSDKVAFILFDNEEKGLLGSKALSKRDKESFENKLVLNFDCVGNGDQILLVAKEKAQSHALYQNLTKAFESSDKFAVHFFPFKTSFGNSDHKNFENGIGIFACKKGKLVKFYTPLIHTNKDVIAKSENVDYLLNQTLKFINQSFASEN